MPSAQRDIVIKKKRFGKKHGIGEVILMGKGGQPFQRPDLPIRKKRNENYEPKGK